jgi:hypothetical protein
MRAEKTRIKVKRAGTLPAPAQTSNDAGRLLLPIKEIEAETAAAEFNHP